jgi:hypothetical protein
VNAERRGASALAELQLALFASLKHSCGVKSMALKLKSNDNRPPFHHSPLRDGRCVTTA